MKKILIFVLFVLLFLPGCGEEKDTVSTTKISSLSFYEESLELVLGNEAILPLEYSGSGTLNDIVFQYDSEIIAINDFYDTITPLKVGKTTILVHSKEDAEINARLEVKVVEEKTIVTTIFIKLRTNAIRVNDSLDLVIENLDRLESQDLSSYNWSVSDPTVLKIENFKVYGLKTGKATVNVYEIAHPQNTGEVTIYVGYDSLATTNGEPDPTTPLILYTADNNYEIPAGVPTQLIIFNAVNQQRYYYTSSNENVMCISEKGIIIGYKPGTSTITVISKEAKNPIVNKISVRIVGNSQLNFIERLLNVAIGEEGYTEWTNSNDTKYGEWNHCNYEEWCATFVSWCANEAGIPPVILPRTISVNVFMNKFSAMDQFFYKENYTPVAGDLIIFKNDGASHVGIVIYSDLEKVYTIEGNTSNMVAKREYLLTHNTITGYCHPNYGEYSFATGIK